MVLRRYGDDGDIPGDRADCTNCEQCKDVEHDRLDRRSGSCDFDILWDERSCRRCVVHCMTFLRRIAVENALNEQDDVGDSIVDCKYDHDP